MILISYVTFDNTFNFNFNFNCNLRVQGGLVLYRNRSSWERLLIAILVRYGINSVTRKSGELDFIQIDVVVQESYKYSFICEYWIMPL